MSTVEVGTAASGHRERLAGMTVLVTGAPALATKLSIGLRQLGCAATVLPSPGACDGSGAPAEPFASREAAVDACGAAAHEMGGLDALVHAPALPELGGLAFADTSEDMWMRCAEAPIWEAFVLFQAAFATFDRAGSIVAAVPSIALTGAARLAPVAAAGEGVRQLAKSAARAWGASGTRVNCVTLPLEEWDLAQAQAVPNRYGASLPGDNSVSDIAGAVAALISPFGRGVTGATIGLDRGTVLAP
jgi:NAD(P)-dependent dehydrogenase (short-subunit alcohol dehydrogenase family)